MVALNFKSQFAEAVESGSKKQTIRAFRKDNRDPQYGDALQLYTGMRSKQCRKLRDAKVGRVTTVTIYENGAVYGDRGLAPRELENFARNDGFPSFGHMADFFEAEHGLPFTGMLIEWD